MQLDDIELLSGAGAAAAASRTVDDTAAGALGKDEVRNREDGGGASSIGGEQRLLPETIGTSSAPSLDGDSFMLQSALT